MAAPTPHPPRSTHPCATCIYPSAEALVQCGAYTPILARPPGACPPRTAEPVGRLSWLPEMARGKVNWAPARHDRRNALLAATDASTAPRDPSMDRWSSRACSWAWTRTPRSRLASTLGVDPVRYPRRHQVGRRWCRCGAAMVTPIAPASSSSCPGFVTRSKTDAVSTGSRTRTATPWTVGCSCRPSRSAWPWRGGRVRGGRTSEASR